MPARRRVGRPRIRRRRRGGNDDLPDVAPENHAVDARAPAPWYKSLRGIHGRVKSERLVSRGLRHLGFKRLSRAAHSVGYGRKRVVRRRRVIRRKRVGGSWRKNVASIHNFVKRYRLVSRGLNHVGFKRLASHAKLAGYGRRRKRVVRKRRGGSRFPLLNLIYKSTRGLSDIAKKAGYGRRRKRVVRKRVGGSWRKVVAKVHNHVKRHRYISRGLSHLGYKGLSAHVRLAGYGRVRRRKSVRRVRRGGSARGVPNLLSRLASGRPAGSSIGAGRYRRRRAYRGRRRGGSFFGRIGNWFKGAANTVYNKVLKPVHSFVKDNKLISRFAGYIPHPAGKAIAAGAALAGYGRVRRRRRGGNFTNMLLRRNYGYRTLGAGRRRKRVVRKRVVRKRRVLHGHGAMRRRGGNVAPLRIPRYYQEQPGIVRF